MYIVLHCTRSSENKFTPILEKKILKIFLYD